MKRSRCSPSTHWPSPRRAQARPVVNGPQLPFVLCLHRWAQPRPAAQCTTQCCTTVQLRLNSRLVPCIAQCCCSCIAQCCCSCIAQCCCSCIAQRPNPTVQCFVAQCLLPVQIWLQCPLLAILPGFSFPPLFSPGGGDGESIQNGLCYSSVYRFRIDGSGSSAKGIVIS